MFLYPSEYYDSTYHINFKKYYDFAECFTSYNQKIVMEDESFKEELNNSNYVKKLDLAAIGLNAVSSGIMVIIALKKNIF